MPVIPGDTYAERAASSTLGGRIVSGLKGLPQIPNILDYGAVGDNVTDNSAAIQRAIDETYKKYGSGGGCILIPQGIFRAHVKLRSRVYLIGEGWNSVIKGLGQDNRPVIDSPKTPDTTAPSGHERPAEMYHAGLQDLRIDGAAREGGTGDGAWFGNSGDDNVRWSVSGWWSPDTWNDPAIRLYNCMFVDCGRDGYYIGRSMRGTSVVSCFSFRCRRYGHHNIATDTWTVNTDAGACGTGFAVIGSNNKYANCKGWYSINNGDAGANTAVGGTDYNSDLFGGNDWLIKGGNNQFTGCESQDGGSYGVLMENAKGNTFRGFQVGGTATAAFRLNAACQRNEIDAKLVGADRTTTNRFVVVTSSDAKFNRFTLSESFDVAHTPGTYAMVGVSGGATLGQNAWTGQAAGDLIEAFTFVNGYTNADLAGYWYAGFRWTGDQVLFMGTIQSAATTPTEGVNVAVLPGHLKPRGLRNWWVHAFRAADNSHHTVRVQVDMSGNVKVRNFPAPPASGSHALQIDVNEIRFEVPSPSL